MLRAGTVLIVDSDNASLETVIACAVQRGETPVLCSSYGEARTLLAQRRFRVVFCNDELAEGKYAEVIKAAKPAPVIVLSRIAAWSSYLDALDAGAFDYIAYPAYRPEVERILFLALNERPLTGRQRGAAA